MSHHEMHTDSAHGACHHCEHGGVLATIPEEDLNRASAVFTPSFLILDVRPEDDLDLPSTEHDSVNENRGEEDGVHELDPASPPGLHSDDDDIRMPVPVITVQTPEDEEEELEYVDEPPQDPYADAYSQGVEYTAEGDYVPDQEYYYDEGEPEPVDPEEVGYEEELELEPLGEGPELQEPEQSERPLSTQELLASVLIPPPPPPPPPAYLPDRRHSVQFQAPENEKARSPFDDEAALPPLPAMVDHENSAVAIPNTSREIAVPMYFKQLQPECTIPSQRNRCDKNIKPPISSKKWILKPLKTFSSRIITPSEWEHKTHPNGRPYYLNRSSSRRFRFITEANMQDSHVVGNVERFIDTIEGLAVDVSERRLPGVTTEVVLELEDFSWKYYIVDHERRELVWLQKYDATWMSERVGGAVSESHMQLCLEEQYWMHIEHYPHQHVIPDGVIDEITSIVAFGEVDCMTSRGSNFPYKVDDSEKLLTLLKTLRRLSLSDGADNATRCFTTATMARLMSTFCHDRFMNFYGQHYAARDARRIQSARQGQNRDLLDAQQRTWLLRVFSPLFFRAPDTHLRGMQNAWVDGAVQHEAWTTFIAGVQREWEGLVLYAALLLNANIAFLVAPVLALKDAPARTAQAASQVSLATSLGSIVVGLLLARQHRNKDDSAQRAAKYLNKRTHPRLGLETLSILYSLPYALLMWGVTSLLVAIASTAFKVSGLAQSLTNATAWGCVTVLIAWTIFTSLERGSDTNKATDAAAQSSRCGPGNVNSDELTKEKFDDALHNFQIAEKARTKRMRMRRLSATAAGLVRRSRDSMHFRRKRAHRTSFVE